MNSLAGYTTLGYTCCFFIVIDTFCRFLELNITVKKHEASLISPTLSNFFCFNMGMICFSLSLKFHNLIWMCLDTTDNNSQWLCLGPILNTSWLLIYYIYNLLQQRWRAVTETVWLAKLNIFTVEPFRGTFEDPCSSSLL